MMQVKEAIEMRYSTRTYSDKSISKEDLHELLAAIQDAPSCFNEQPWRIFYANKAEQTEFYNLLLNLLNEGNRPWAERAPVLMITAVSTTFERNGKSNFWAMHDLGLGIGQMSLLASAKGLSVHQMGGFDAEKASEVLNLPEGWQPVTAISLGVPVGEQPQRQRKLLNETMFHKALEDENAII